MTHRIVAVDYDAKIGERLRSAFRPPEFDLHWFSDGREALDSLRDIRPHVIVCDLLLPGMGGRAVLDEVKRSPGLRDVPFLILSTVRSEATIRAALDAGAEAFLLKPYPIQELVRTIRRLLDGASPQGSGVVSVTRIRERNQQPGAPGARPAEPVDAGGVTPAAGASRISSLELDGAVVRIATEARSGQKLVATTTVVKDGEELWKVERTWSQRVDGRDGADSIQELIDHQHGGALQELGSRRAQDPRLDLLRAPAAPLSRRGTARSHADQTESPRTETSAGAAHSEADQRSDAVALDSVVLEHALVEEPARPEPDSLPGAPQPQGRVLASRYVRQAAVATAALALATLLFKIRSTTPPHQETPEARSAAPSVPAATPAVPEPTQPLDARSAGDPQAAVHDLKGAADAPAPTRAPRPRQDSQQIAQGRLQWAQALYDGGRYEESRVALSEVFKLAPSDPEARRLAAKLEDPSDAHDATGPEGAAAGNPSPIQAETPAQQDRRAVQALLARYQAALQQKDLAALKAVWPGLDEIRMRERLQFVRSWSLTLRVVELQVTGDVASALCESSDTLLTVDDEVVQNKSRVQFALRRQGGSWVIDAMR